MDISLVYSRVDMRHNHGRSIRSLYFTIRIFHIYESPSSLLSIWISNNKRKGTEERDYIKREPTT